MRRTFVTLLLSLILPAVLVSAEQAVVVPQTANIRPEQYGARGDGRTDDTRALRAMAAAVTKQGGNATITFTPGKTYLLGNESTARGQETMLFDNVKHLIMQGYGATLKSKDNGIPSGSIGYNWGMMNFWECQDVRILGLHFDGNRDNQKHIAGGEDGHNFGLNLRQGRDYLIRDCTFENTGALRPGGDKRGDAIFMTNGTSFVTIESCTFRNVGRWSFAMELGPGGTDTVIFRNNRVLTPPQTSGDPNIPLGGLDFEDPNPYKNIYITGNYFEGKRLCVSFCGFGYYQIEEPRNQLIENIVISDNIWQGEGGMDGYEVAIMMHGMNWSKLRKTYKNVRITGNRFYYKQRPPYVVDAGHTSRLEDFTFANNFIDGGDLGMPRSAQGGLRLAYVGSWRGDITVANNVFRNCGSAIEAAKFNEDPEKPNYNLWITNNIIHDCHRSFLLLLGTQEYDRSSSCFITGNVTSNLDLCEQVHAGNVKVLVNTLSQHEGMPRITNYGQKDIGFIGDTHGNTADRKTAGKHVGQQYFDTELGKPLFWNGRAWVDSNGAAVP